MLKKELEKNINLTENDYRVILMSMYLTKTITTLNKQQASEFIEYLSTLENNMLYKSVKSVEMPF